MRKYLHVAPNFKVPVDIVTQTVGILAVKRAGKSNAAVRIAEQMYKAGLPFVAIDPKGDWWGMRSSKDGKGPGLEVALFGAPNRKRKNKPEPDLPLEETTGKFIADLLVDEPVPSILDVSGFSEAAKVRFLYDFVTQLFERNEEPLHIFAEECDDYIPQNLTGRPEMARLVHAFTKLVKQGGAFGLGVSLISQRSAVVNKNVLTQIGTLIAMRTTSPQDIKAIAEWVKYHGQSEELLSTLSSLEDGEAWVWSPQWLKVVERIRFERRETYDSGATPKVGEKRRMVKLADLDKAALAERMAETIEKFKAEDPKELQRENLSLRKDLKAAQAQYERLAKVEPKEEIVEVPALLADEKQLLGDVRGLLEKTALDTAALSSSFSALGQDVGALLGDVARRVSASVQEAVHKSVPAAVPRPPPTRVLAQKPALRDGDTVRVKAGARRMLSVLAQFHPQPLTRRQLGTLAGVSMGGTFSTYIGALNANGWVEENGVGVSVTADGLSAAGPVELGPQTTEDLVAIYGRKLKAGARRMLDELVEAHPAGLGRAELSERTSVTMGGTFSTYLGALKTNGLAEERSGEVFASDTLFIFM